MRCVFFDLETGGIDPNKHAIIQIGALAVELATLEVVDQYEAKVQFVVANADPEALEKNSYNAEEWALAENPYKVAKSFGDFLGKYANVDQVSKRTGREYQVALCAAYNSDFDKRFLFAWFKRLNKFCPAYPRMLCVMQRAMWYFHESQETPPADFKLETVASYFNIPIKAHDAVGDVEATLDVLSAIWREEEQRAIS